MKKVAGTLKIDQAQYRELEGFAKFGSDMDAVTAFTIDKGRKNSRLLIQPQYSPMPVEEQIAILYCGVHGLLKDVPLESVQGWESQYLENLRLSHKEDVLIPLKSGNLTNEVVQALEKVAKETVF